MGGGKRGRKECNTCVLLEERVSGTVAFKHICGEVGRLYSERRRAVNWRQPVRVLLNSTLEKVTVLQSLWRLRRERKNIKIKNTRLREYVGNEAGDERSKKKKYDVNDKG